MHQSVTIVDDCKELRYLFSILLREELGLPCVSVGSLEEVKAQADNVLGSRAVILDINLGAGQPDGVAVHEWLCGREYAGEVLFLTGHAKESPQVRAAAQTGVQIFEKPLMPDELVQLLKNILREEPSHEGR